MECLGEPQLDSAILDIKTRWSVIQIDLGMELRKAILRNMWGLPRPGIELVSSAWRLSW